jgi:CDP-paratose 2-epimerase
VQIGVQKTEKTKKLKKIMITGGAGFIGVNAAQHFSAHGWSVVLLDNLSRRSAQENLDWIRQRAQVAFEYADVRAGEHIEKIVDDIKPDAILHLAAQVAVTTSVDNPREDFEINALGTLNLLEAIRQTSPKTFFMNASSNKVYGKMEDLAVTELDGRYEYKDLQAGVSEDRALDFHSPYGCSKGTADQYTIDYSRIYDLNTVSFRQSCIYGRRQFGMEEQGWIAWFAIAAVLGRPITLYGDGKQVRDALHVKDLVRAYELAWETRHSVSGQVFNIGGGPANTISLLEVIGHLEANLGINIPIVWRDWRPGDQPVFVCDIEKARRLLEWHPTITVYQGMDDLTKWVQDNKSLISRLGS